MSTLDQAISSGSATVGEANPAEERRVRVRWGALTKYFSLPLLFLAGVAVINFWSLMHTPAPFVDEGWYANRAYAQVQTGFGFGTLDAGIPDKFPGYWMVLAWIQPVIESIPIRLLGMSLFAVRLESLVFGIALLAVIYAIIKQIYNSRAAFITIAVGSFSWPFVYSSHLARPDILIVLCGFGAVALYVYDRSPGLSAKSVLSGLIIGLAFDIHLNIVLFVPVMLGLFFLDFRWRMFRTGRFWGFATGVGIGLAFFVAIHILPNYQSYMEVNRIEQALSQTPPILMPRPDIWLVALEQTAILVGVYLWPLLIAALVVLVKRRSHSDKQLLIIFGGIIGSFAALRPYWPDFYMILVAPPVWFLLGALIDYLLNQPWKRTVWVYTRTVAVVSLMLISYLYPVTRMFDDPGDDWQVTLARVRETLPANSKVIGQQSWWFARATQPYVSWEQLGYYRRYAPGHTLEDAFRTLGPEYLIMDNVTDSYLLNSISAADADYFSYHVLKSDMEDFVRKHCRPVSTVTTRTFGAVRIYQIVW